MDPRPTPIRSRMTPAMLTLIATTVIGLVSAFNVFELTQEQIGAILTAVGTLGIILVALGVLSSEGQVTPVSDPQLPAGTQVKVTNGNGEVASTQTLTTGGH